MKGQFIYSHNVSRMEGRKWGVPMLLLELRKPRESCLEGLASPLQLSNLGSGGRPKSVNIYNINVP